MTNVTEVRVIHTGLYSDVANAVINGVHGQLSDGKWENSPSYDKYWTNFDVKRLDDGEVVIEVNNKCYVIYCSKALPNPFYAMPDDRIKTWIAQKIKAVVNDERKDRVEFGAWDRRNIDHISLYLGHADEKYGTVVTVADVYCTYEMLLGRPVGITKYNSGTICRVVGSKRNDEEIAKHAAHKAERQKALDDYNEHIASIDKMLKDFQQKCVDDRSAAHRALLDAYNMIDAKYAIA